jgi:hypothetical protein
MVDEIGEAERDWKEFGPSSITSEIRIVHTHDGRIDAWNVLRRCFEALRAQGKQPLRKRVIGQWLPADILIRVTDLKSGTKIFKGRLGKTAPNYIRRKAA